MSKLGALLGAITLSLAAISQASSAPAALDPSGLILTPKDQIKWSGQPGGVRTAVLYGDPSKEGLYVQLIQWPATANSRPHSHPHDRQITVLEGTWWVGTGAKYSPDTMTPVHVGDTVRHPAGGIHYDGTKGEPALIEVVGMGPGTLIPREDPPQPRPAPRPAQ